MNYAKSYLTVAYPEVWLFVLGGLFVGVTVFLPRGLMGLLNDIRERFGVRGGVDGHVEHPPERGRDGLRDVAQGRPQ